MRRMRGWVMRVAGLFNRERRNRELEEEMESHLLMHIQDNLRLGMTAEEARRQAIIKLGGIESTKEACRDQGGLPALETLWQDIRYGTRVLHKNAGFTVVAVLTLGLGIGASTGMFIVLQGVLFRQPPYPQPERLIKITETQSKSGASRGTSPVNLLYWEQANTTFSGLSAYFGANANGSATGDSEALLTGIGEPVRLRCLGVLPGLFDVLGVAPMLGRNFARNEVYDATVVILSYACWQRQFAADPNIIGRSITLGGNAKTVIGVMPKSFFFPSKEFQVFWTPGMNPGTFESDQQSWLSVIARLKPGISIQQATSQMVGLEHQLQTLYPEQNRDAAVHLEDFHSFITTSSRPALLLLFVAVELLFLIVCSNLTNLQLSRAASRRREFSIRNALGASHGRLIRQLLTESMILSTLGGLLGLAAAIITQFTLNRLFPQVVPTSAELRIDSRVILFNVAITAVAPMLFGIIPALSASRPEHLSQRNESAPRSSGKVREILVSSEVALTVILLVGAGLLFHSFLSLERADPGFRTEHAVSFRLISTGREGGLSGGLRTLADIEKRLRSLPGVQAAGGTWSLPLRSLQDPEQTVTIEGRPGDAEVLRGAITDEYFKALLTPLLRGRFFNESDTAASPPVAIGNAAFEKACFHGENSLGKRFKYGHLEDANRPWITIVGIVADQKRNGIDKPVPPAIWGPVSQVTPPTLSFVLRGEGDPTALVASARREIQSAYKDITLMDVATLHELVQTSIGDQRFRTSLVCAFAGVALLLSAIGVYGMLAFSIAQRSIEIGIRMALGAQRGDVLRLLLRQGIKPAAIGLAIGLAGALASSRVLQGFLYDVLPSDPLTFVTVPLVLALVALLACWFPARRATRVELMVALRGP